MCKIAVKAAESLDVIFLCLLLKGCRFDSLVLCMRRAVLLLKASHGCFFGNLLCVFMMVDTLLCCGHVQAALPFKSKPKVEAPRKHKTLEQKRAIPLEPAERKAVSLYAQLNAIRNEKAEKRRAQQSRRRVVRTGTRWLAGCAWAKREARSDWHAQQRMHTSELVPVASRVLPAKSCSTCRCGRLLKHFRMLCETSYRTSEGMSQMSLPDDAELPLQEHTKKLQATNEWRDAKRKEERKKRCDRIAADLNVLYTLLLSLGNMDTVSTLH